MVFNSTITSGASGVEEENNCIIRVGFTNSGLKVLNFRNNIEEYKAAVRLWYTQLSDKCQYSRILSKMVQYEDMVTARDIVPRKDLDKEYFFQAQSSAVSKCFGSSSPIRRMLLPLPPSRISNHSISLVVEFYVRMSGNMRSIIGQMKEHELISFFYCYLADQLSFKSQLGKFHVDGHAGNLLYSTRLSGKYSFVWSDFGKTSESSLMGSQFRNSLISVHISIRDAAVLLNYNRVIELLDFIAICSNNYDSKFIMDEINMQHVHRNMADAILDMFNSTEVATILEDVAPFSSFGIQHMRSQIFKLMRNDAEQRKNIEELKKSDAEQKKINAELMQSHVELKKSDAEQKKINAELMQSHVELKKSDAEQKKINAELMQSDAEQAKIIADLNKIVGEIWAELRMKDSVIDKKNAELDTKNAELDTKNSKINEL